MAAELDLSSIAELIARTPHGYWRAAAAAPVSYPSEAHDRCDAIAESSFWFPHRNRVILAAVEQLRPADGLIADIGGGNGYVAAMLQAAGFGTVVIEPAESAALNAVRRGVTHVICGSAESAGLKPSSVGGVGLFDVLEHIEDDAAFLSFVRTRIKPRGRLYATVPAFQSLWSDADVSAGHYRRYRAGAITRLARAAGFQVDYCTYFFWCLPPAMWASRSLPWRLGRRRERSRQQVEAEHGLRSPRLGALLRALMAPELALIRGLRSIPIGTSCLLVATAPHR
jgi:SAM-dependent methyltransferase